MRMVARFAVLLLLLGVVVVSAGLWIGWQLSRPVPKPIGLAPPDFGAESVRMRSDSGSTLGGWFVPVVNPAAAVLLLPSIRANRQTMVRRARFLKDAGYAALLIDFQATGESPGDAITFGWRERHDVLAAVQFLKGRLPNKAIGIIGTSLVAQRRFWPHHRCRSTRWSSRRSILSSIAL